MTNVYRIKLIRWNSKDKDFDKEEYREYCLNNSVLACGWPANEECYSLKEYTDQVEKKFEKGDYDNHSSWVTACNEIDEMSRYGGLCWTQGKGGKYYLGEVFPNTPIKFSVAGYPKIGICVKCNWKKFELDSVPGKVLSCLIKGKTLQRINNDDIAKYSENLYRGKKQSKIDFFPLLHADDLEDLLGLYLQEKEEYFVFPSTNKSGTAFFEYMLIHKKKHNKAVIQCKIGDEGISSEDINIFKKEYSDYKVFITTIKNEDYSCKNIETIKKETLKKWAEDNEDILPDRIKKFLEYSK